jgi:hypothetical protein
MRSSGISAADWGVITEYLKILKLLKFATKRLEGRGKSGQYGAIYELILVFEYIMRYYEQRVALYADVDYNVHADAPEDYLVINLRAARLRLATITLSLTTHRRTTQRRYYTHTTNRTAIERGQTN